MTASSWLELGCGVVLALIVLLDLFSTLLVPGPSAGRPSVLINLRRVIHPIWFSAGRRREHHGSGAHFAPFILVLAFLCWMLLLMLAFGLMLHALRQSFDPDVLSFAEALYLAGCSLVTLGVSEVDATGAARWIVLFAGLSGFSAVTATITFSIQIQSGLRQRETGVLTLGGIAGEPPSGIAILETLSRFAESGELEDFFHHWRTWSAGVMHNHSSFPVLSYFGSSGRGIDWLSALEAVLDAATLVSVTDETRASGAAMLMHRTGSMVTTRLRRTAGLAATHPTQDGSFAELVDRLHAAGFAIDARHAEPRFWKLRADYAGDIAALAESLGTHRAVLVPAAG